MDGSLRCRSRRGRWEEGQVDEVLQLLCSSLVPSTTQPLRECSSDKGPAGRLRAPIMEFLWNDAARHHTTDTLLLSTRVFRKAVTDSESKGERRGREIRSERGKQREHLTTLIEGRGPEKIFAGKPRHGRGRYPARAAYTYLALTCLLLLSVMLLPSCPLQTGMIDLSKSRNDPAGSSDQATSHTEPHSTTQATAAPSLCHV